MKEPTREEVAELLAKATPGDWRAVRRTIGQQILPENYELQACFVEPVGIQVYGPDWKHTKEMSGKGSTYICANAALIALAPFLARAYVDGGMAAEVAWVNRYEDGEWGGAYATKAEAAEAIRFGTQDAEQIEMARVSPTPDDLDAAALARPKVRALVEALELILPLARGYHGVAQNIGSNRAYIAAADAALAALKGTPA